MNLPINVSVSKPVAIGTDTEIEADTAPLKIDAVECFDQVIEGQMKSEDHGKESTQDKTSEEIDAEAPDGIPVFQLGRMVHTPDKNYGIFAEMSVGECQAEQPVNLGSELHDGFEKTKSLPIVDVVPDDSVADVMQEPPSVEGKADKTNLVEASKGWVPNSVLVDTSDSDLPVPVPETKTRDSVNSAVTEGLVPVERNVIDGLKVDGKAELLQQSCVQDRAFVLAAEVEPTAKAQADQAEPNKQTIDRPTFVTGSGPLLYTAENSEEASVQELGPNGKEPREIWMQLGATGNSSSVSAAINPGSTTNLQSINPARIITFISDSSQQLTDQPIELVLNPQELGHVRLRLNASDGAMGVILTVERAETLELLRRNIDLLADQLSEIGFENLSFEFVERDGQAGEFQNAREDEAEGTEDLVAPIEITQIQKVDVMPAEGVDIRL